MDEPHIIKEVIWIGSSRKDLKALPEIVGDYQTDTYRAVYTVKGHATPKAQMQLIKKR